MSAKKIYRNFISLLFKPGPWIQIAVGGVNIHSVHYFDHGYFEDEKINDT